MVNPPQAKVLDGSANVSVVTDGAFDAEAAIKALLADPSLASLEMPGLTVDQRKEIKQVVNQHPELKCESFGFGEDRQLHIFKRRPSTAASTATDVPSVSTDVPSAAASSAATENWAPPGGRFIEKNTFIHDWVESEDESGVESVIFRSMPVELSERCLLNWQRLSQDAVQLPFLCKGSSGGKEQPGVTSPDVMPSPSTASTSAGSPASIQSLFSFSSQSLQGTPCHAQHNSCSTPDILGPAPALPPGIWATPVMVPVSSASPSMMSMERDALAPGTRVLISGLVKLPEFNGLRAVVQSLDTRSGRYDVLLDSAVGVAGQRIAKIRRENLSLLVMPHGPLRPGRVERQR